MSNLRIIGFEGIDGSGKTSLIEKLLSDDVLADKVIYTSRRYPQSPFVEKMYSIIHTFEENFDALRLFVEDMRYRYSKLPQDKIILSDRTFLSALVFYKSIKEISGLFDDNLYNKIKKYLQIYHPYLTILLLVDVDKARERIHQSRKSFGPVENILFQTVCSKNFTMVEPSDSVLVLDAGNLTEIEVYKIVKEKINALDLNPLQ